MNDSDSESNCGSEASDVENGAYKRHVEFLLMFIDTLTDVTIGDSWYAKGTLFNVKKFVRQIGTNDRVTLLYDTMTDVKRWALAIAPYKQRIVEYTMFALQQHYIDRPLDRMVYDMLSEQSFTIGYDTYKNLATEKRLAAANWLVSLLASTKNYCVNEKTDISSDDWARGIAEKLRERRKYLELVILTITDFIYRALREIIAPETIDKLRTIAHEIVNRKFDHLETYRARMDNLKRENDDSMEAVKPKKKRNTCPSKRLR